MPIKGLSDRRRLPRLGKIRLGVKAKSGRTGGLYPKAVDYFVCPPEVCKALGEEHPRRLRIIIPLEDEEIFAQQWYRAYSGSRGLICRGDGEKAVRTFDKDTGGLATQASVNTERREEYSCQGEECLEYKAKQCRRVMNFQFFLPDVPGLGVWQLDTSSLNSIVAINSGVEMVRAVCGRVAMIPLVLSLWPLEVTPEGEKKKTVWVLHLTADASLAEIQRLALIPAARVMLPAPEPPEKEEAPVDLFPENGHEEDEGQGTPPAQINPVSAAEKQGDEIGAQQIVPSRLLPPAPAKEVDTPPREATAGQREMAAALAQKLGWEGDDYSRLRELTRSMFGLAKGEHLNIVQADKLKVHLQGLVDKKERDATLNEQPAPLPSIPPADPKSKTPSGKVYGMPATKAQLDYIVGQGRKLAISEDGVREKVRTLTGVEWDALNTVQANAVITALGEELKVRGSTEKGANDGTK